MYKMSKKKEVFLISAFWMIITIPLLCLILNIEIHVPLTNTEPAPKPLFSYSSFLDGDYQDRYDTYWSSAFPNHNILVKAYNQFRYSVFGECVYPYVRGKNDWIHDINYIDEALCLDVTHSRKSSDFETYFDILEDVYQKAKLLNKKICLILSANKVDFTKDTLPGKYQFASAAYDSTNADIFRGVISKYSIPYIDGRSILESIENPSYQTFGRGGIHWTTSAAAEILKIVFSDISRQSDSTIPQFTIAGSYTRSTKDYAQDDDIWAVLNIWSKPENDYIYPIIVNNPTNIEKEYPRIVMQGGSFCFPLLDLIQSNALAESIDFIYYEQSIYSWIFGDMTPTIMLNRSMPLSSYDQESVVDSIIQSDWIIFEINEQYLWQAIQDNKEDSPNYRFISIVDKTLSDMLSQEASDNSIACQDDAFTGFVNFKSADDQWYSMGLGRGKIILAEPNKAKELELWIPWSSYIEFCPAYDHSVSVYADGQEIAKLKYGGSPEQYILIPLPEGTKWLDLYSSGIMDLSDGTQPMTMYYSLNARIREVD